MYVNKHLKTQKGTLLFHILVNEKKYELQPTFLHTSRFHFFCNLNMSEVIVHNITIRTPMHWPTIGMCDHVLDFL
jgi:hypothetical protein